MLHREGVHTCYMFPRPVRSLFRPFEIELHGRAYFVSTIRNIRYTTAHFCFLFRHLLGTAFDRDILICVQRSLRMTRNLTRAKLKLPSPRHRVYEASLR